MHRRGSGILLHMTSLPSPYGIGDLGPGAYRFADFLAHAKQGYWQVLPLNPVNPGCGHSPYSSISAFAGNTLLISPELLHEDGLLSWEEIESRPVFPQDRCDFARVLPYKEALFERAWQRFQATGKDADRHEAFCLENAGWLEDFALFVVLRNRFQGRVWSEWPVELRDRQPEALQAIRKECRSELEKEKFLQHLFFKQWRALRAYCHRRGIQLLGDLAIYMSFDSADVWANSGLFKLDEAKRPAFVSGVPPDYFSETGQLWGNPVYRWEVLRETGFAWWIERLAHSFALFDVIRIDHFRGLVAFWEVPAGEKTAVRGRWVEAPVQEFFAVLMRRFFHFPVIAEDLGVITPDVREVLHRFEFPGMKVLVFAFDRDDPMHPYLPHTYEKNFVVYTGTHDNNTIRGWFDGEAAPEEKWRLFRYVGREVPANEVHWELIRLAMMSVARMVIVPMQDILGLGGEARMNRPSVADGNWDWRMSPEPIAPEVMWRLLEMTEIYGRA